jgi:O-antigen/teichoic acid export membrane protein
MEPEQYAVFSNLFAIANLAGVFTSLYMDNAYARFYFDAEGDKVKQRRMFSTIFIFMTAWGLLSSVAIYFIIQRPVALKYEVPAMPYVFLVCIIALLRQFNIFFSVNYRVEHKSFYVTGAGYLWCGTSTAVSLLLLLVFKLGPLALLWGVFAGEVTSYLYYYVRLLKEKIIIFEFSVGFIREALVYSLGLLPLTVSSWLSGYSDRLLITWFGDLADSGVYSVAFEIGRVINVVVISIFMVYGPMMLAMLKEGRGKHINRIEVFQSFLFHFLLCMAFFLSLFTPELFKIFVGPKYHVGIPLVPVIAFSFVFAGVRRLFVTPIYYHKLTLLISLGGILQAGVNFGMNVILIPYYGGQAAAWSKLVCMFAVGLYFYILCRKYEPIQIDIRSLIVTVSMLCAGLGVFLICVYIFKLGVWPLFFVKVLIFVFALLCTWYSRFGKAMRLLVEHVRDRKKGGDTQAESSGDLLRQ